MFEEGKIHVPKEMILTYSKSYDIPLDLKAFLKDLLVYSTEEDKIEVHLREW